jgi:spore coat polysaccharide biosynthesis protein SpsF
MIVAVIQARMGSSRLPGKALKDINGRTMLARVVRRISRSAQVNRVIVATTTASRDKAIIDECESLGIQSFRGSEQDVLDRYYRAAKLFDAEAVVRITSDCPLIDPEIIDQVIQAFRKDGADYASNTIVGTYPRGLDVEVFTFSALEKAWREAHEPYQRVHVTPYFYQNPELFRLVSVTGADDNSHYRWTVDTKEDLDLVRTIYARLDRDDSFSWRDVLNLVKIEPELMDINRHIQQKSLEEC